MDSEGKIAPTQAQVDAESRSIRRLRIAVALALEVIARGELSYEEALQTVAATRRVALSLFPGKGSTFDLIYLPRFQRLIREVFRVQ